MSFAETRPDAGSDSLRSQALGYILNDRFHRRFELPATADHEDLIVSYADVGRVPGTTSTSAQPTTILFMPGMFASRYAGVLLHAIAEKLGMRILVVDRPGMGQSTNVPLHQRVPIWIELVPRLLAHLGIEHVALVSHSAGTIFLLNTLYHCRDILYPERPFAALLSTYVLPPPLETMAETIIAPWVDPSHSHVRSMQMVGYLPAKSFSIWHQIPRFVVTQAEPALASSGAVFTKFSNVISFGAMGAGQDNSGLERNRRRIERDYGVSRDMQIELEALTSKLLFDEETVGANSEALLCLKKGPSGIWGKCDDYALFVRELVDLERERRAIGSNTERGVRLKVRAYFSQTDSMIGKRGQSYVEACWKGERSGEFDDVLDFRSSTIDATDHDSILRSVKVLERLFVDAGGSI